MWSPDGSLLYQHRGHGNFVLDARRPWTGQIPRRLPQDGVDMFTPWAFSPDATQLIGGLRWAGAPIRSLGRLDLRTGRYESLTTRGLQPALWLDTHRILFHDRDTLLLLDTVTRRTQALLSVAPDTLDTISLSPDQHAIFFDRTAHESDLWLATP